MEVILSTLSILYDCVAAWQKGPNVGNMKWWYNTSLPNCTH